jgi:putative transposase
VREYISLGLKRDQAFKLAKISKDQYYYRPTGKKGGPSRSKETIKFDELGMETKVSNSIVVSEMKAIKENPELSCGYHLMTYGLQSMGYMINHKKVYRLMKENNLLEVIKREREKNYAKYRIVVPDGPLQVLEMDIKLVWVEESKKYVQILTIIDTFTRVVLYWTAGYTMRKEQVKAAWSHVIERHLQAADTLKRALHIEVRNDNGPQFSAKAVQEFFIENNLNQVFTHPYTPQENGHIESFHSILSKHLKRNTYWKLEQLESDLTLFYERYNNTRLHGSIAYLPPMVFWKCWEKGLVNRKELSKKNVKFKLVKPHYLLIREIRA